MPDGLVMADAAMLDSAIALDHPPHPLRDRRIVGAAFGEGVLAGMTLDVGFVKHPQA